MPPSRMAPLPRRPGDPRGWGRPDALPSAGAKAAGVGAAGMATAGRKAVWMKAAGVGAAGTKHTSQIRPAAVRPSRVRFAAPPLPRRCRAGERSPPRISSEAARKAAAVPRKSRAAPRKTAAAQNSRAVCRQSSLLPRALAAGCAGGHGAPLPRAEG